MQTVLITGSSGGLGVCLCREFLKRGWQVCAWHGRRAAALDPLKAEYGDRLQTQQVDLRNTMEVERAAQAIRDAHPTLDMLINGAAILPPNSAELLESFDVDGSLEVLDVNTLGPLRVTKALLPALRQSAAGRILNITSEAGSLSSHADYINRYDYCMSKAALNIQSVILNRYLKPEGIPVLLVHPGWVRTGMGGPDAPLSPEQSAKDICSIATDNWPAEHLFVNYDGSPRAW